MRWGHILKNIRMPNANTELDFKVLALNIFGLDWFRLIIYDIIPSSAFVRIFLRRINAVYQCRISMTMEIDKFYV